MISRFRLFILAAFGMTLIFFWDMPVLIPLKVFVVYLHELSHALGALLTGGEVRAIAVRWDESGFTRSVGGSFLITAISGYLGSIIWGGLMLNAALRGRWIRTVSFTVGLILLFFTLYPDTTPIENHDRWPKYLSGLFWGLMFLITGVKFPRLNHFVLFFMGGLTSMYALYDLDDFFGGNILQTDAGIIATYYLGTGGAALVLAYVIGVAITVLSVWVLFRVIMHGLHRDDTEEELPDENDLEMSPEMLELMEKFREIQQRQKE